MRQYHRLTFEEREEISRLLANETSIREISRQLVRSPSTISRLMKMYLAPLAGQAAVT